MDVSNQVDDHILNILNHWGKAQGSVRSEKVVNIGMVVVNGQDEQTGAYARESMRAHQAHQAHQMCQIGSTS